MLLLYQTVFTSYSRLARELIHNLCVCNAFLPQSNQPTCFEDREILRRRVNNASIFSQSWMGLILNYRIVMNVWGHCGRKAPIFEKIPSHCAERKLEREYIELEITGFLTAQAMKRAKKQKLWIFFVVVFITFVIMFYFNNFNKLWSFTFQFWILEQSLKFINEHPLLSIHFFPLSRAHVINENRHE